MKMPKRVEGNEMPTRPMNAEPAGGGESSPSQGGEMPTRAMDASEPGSSAGDLSPGEQEKIAAHQRDQKARAASGKDQMPSGN